MKKAGTALAFALASALLGSCGTTHTVRWAYGKTSIFGQPKQFSEDVGLRPAIGVPVILGGVAFDAVTFPLQLIFGVWPWWGSASQHMKPSNV